MAKKTKVKYVPHNRTSGAQLTAREQLYDLFRRRPMPDEELLVNMNLYMRSSLVARQLWINELYELIVDIPGALMEFGVWWGQTLVTLESLRAIHEPYNHARRIIGFDTFEGYPKLSSKDVRSDTIKVGAYGVAPGYQGYLEELMDYHRRENVLPHIKKYELVAGDVTHTARDYLDQHPEMIVALAIFDLALYEPTKKCLEAIRPRLIKGSVIAFDELNCADYPGETLALRETLGLERQQIRRSRFLPDRSYLVVE